MMISYVPPNQETPPPIPVSGCDFQIRLNFGTYQCLTTAQYNAMQEFQDLKAAEQSKAQYDFMISNWWIFAIIGVVLVVALVLSFWNKDDDLFSNINY